jgi:hypothetical protein
MNPTPNQDQEHLGLLAVFHYVVAGLAFVFSSIFIVHIVLGAVFLHAPQRLQGGSGELPPEFMGWIFILTGGSVVLAGWTYAALMLAAGRGLARRKRYSFCLAMAGVSCLFAPVGTVLGVFTLLVLMRPSVKTLFGR